MKKYYIAYGSNLNVQQMKFRCPGAKVVGTSVIRNYELLYKGSKTGSYLTIEKKNGLHAGQLKSYIQLCLALSQMAKDLRTARHKPQQTENPKFAMRTWLMRLGFMGEEFATARDFLTRNLEGDAAFRYGRA